ncbi:ABCG White-like ABC transporter [Encephalitozoon hellem ATCC 50504]|uniref:Sterolin-1 n=1 Tax=Encephalitozoon hellem TaxID=27973 RepID=A0A9Q9C3W5_ENCHE|nr:ABCG White-like ABC transporter [Encephalitozoon hellem ATCC 50504]AFM98708.1 ABCG White-like ABC transporter [Encephalitozoon hellem ATCC 50504]UTX43681.1 sterolin-1 [Encephalitozoon hellem]WEL39157.1 sterolin-1 [Encephalitozoon hellem]|eukprot:XP_003887689.1 ABCG White-like ABC transporter [Encephalitozoon hellem ATCC 50504]
MASRVLRFENVFLKVPNKNKNLNQKYVDLISGISGEIVSGRLTAVMGGSGSSKTSFLNLLMGNVDSDALTSGIVTFDGKQRKVYKWLETTSYLEQFDTFTSGLTVEESIRYSLIFRGREIKDSNIPSIIDDIIRDLGLERLRGTLISSISGGERRRVMLAVELVIDPDVIFLDEPTSGLDSRLALDTVRILKKYAETKNKIVLMTVHQPGNSMFKLFDDMIFLDRGKIVYAGPTSGIDDFLASIGMQRPLNISIAEYLFELEIRNIKPQDLRSPESTKKAMEWYGEATLEKNTQRFAISSVSWRHVWHLFVRQLKIDYRNKVMRNVFLFKMGMATLLFFFLCDKVKYSVFQFINRISPEYSTPGEKYLYDLQIFLEKNYGDLQILYNDVLDFFAYSMLPFVTCFSIFNDSTFLDNSTLLRKESFRCDYSQISLLISTLVYECVFSIIRSSYFCLLLGITQLRDVLTARAVLMFLITPLGMVVFMTMVKAFSKDNYTLNIARVAAFILTTFLRPLWLSMELEDLRDRYWFMKYLYPTSYALFLCPFLLLDALFYVTLGGRSSISPGFISFLSQINGFQVNQEDIPLKDSLNYTITFLNRCYLSDGFLMVLTVFSFLTTLILSALFLVFKFSPNVRLTVSTKSLDVKLDEIIVD